MGVVLNFKRDLQTVEVIKGQFFVQQVLFGDKLGDLKVLSLRTASGSQRNAVLFSVLNFTPTPNFYAAIYSFAPLDRPEQNDGAVHFLQKIPLENPPLVSSLPKSFKKGIKNQN